MRDLLSWNVYLGRWADVHVRLHILFPLLGVFLLHAATRGDNPWPAWYAAAVLLILLASTLLHELAHCLIARRLGGSGDQILLWPFGGLVSAGTPQQPRAELLVALAGPLVNLFACSLAVPVLILEGGATWDLANPLRPPFEASFEAFTWQACLKLAFWLNWVLAVVNLLPAYPMDGGRVVRSLLHARLSHRLAVTWTARCAQLSAVGLWIGAWLAHNSQYHFAWAPLVLLGVVLFFSARQESTRVQEPDRDDTLPAGYDFSEGYTSLERNLNTATSPPATGRVLRWLEERRQARLARQRQLEADEEQRVDAILARLHEIGIDGLSPDERALLDRVSARYRNRAQH